ncbi:MAG: hypothetical protein RBT72_03880 [Spirochaetia bacterium]|jgi:hypothetical protein|nr:hypothetical protein [Spirochaetia bacterium]
MRQKPGTLNLCGILCLCFVLIGQSVFASPGKGLDLGGGALFSFTSLPQLETGFQAGWNANVGVGFTIFPWDDAENRASDSKTATALSLTGRFQLDSFGLGASAPQSDGNLYRAWQGTGLGLLLGFASPEFIMPLLGLPAKFGIEAGGGLRLTKYAGTGLVSAHPAVLGRMTLDFGILDPFALGLVVPLEWAWKSGGRAIILGIGLSLRVL